MSEIGDGSKPLEIPQRLETGFLVDRNNPTAVEIEKTIQETGGKIPFSKFMDLSLYGKSGYYSSGKVEIGKDKDFMTAPEYSDLFGGTIGKGLMKTWEAMNKPARFDVVEMGPGHGTMAYSLLYWTKKLYPEFYEAINYNILEYGTGLIPRQQDKLKAIDKKVNWVIGSAYEIPFKDVTGAFISNELPDAFPVERVTRVNGQIKQKYVTIEQDKWVEILDDPSPEVSDFINSRGIIIEEGIEEPINIQSVKLQSQLDQALKVGVIITIDYGKGGEVGEKDQNLRCYYNSDIRKEFSDEQEAKKFAMYKHPGQVDITASVNFSPMEKQAIEDGLDLLYVNSQSHLLWKFGISELVSQILQEVPKIKSFNELANISRSMKNLHQLVENGKMGSFYASVLFKGSDQNKVKWDQGEIIGAHEGIKIPIKIGKPKTGIQIDFPEDREVLIHGSYRRVPSNHFETDEDGVLWVEPDLLKDSELTLAWTQEKIDLKDKKVFADLLERSGINPD